ncbi:MAG: acetolactate synthase large subunit [Sulfolobales archaeon]
MPTGAKLVVEALRREGVKAIFGIPGLSNMPIYDELIDYLRNEEIKHILMRHEQGAAHAADGYARVSGSPGICTATSGPGSMNLVTGLITAYWDNSPVIAITGQVPRSYIGRKSFQEADVVGVMQHIAKYVVQIKETHEIPLWVKNAFYIATSGKPGPVVIDIPRDLLSSNIEDVTWPEEPMVLGYRPFKSVINTADIAKAVRMLIEAERPLILVGAGVFWSDATEEVMRLSELLICPIVSTLLGKAAIPHDYPLYLGVVGYYGRAEANNALLEADVILVIGARLSDRTLPSYNDIVKDGKKIIIVNIDPTDVMKLPMKVNVEIYGDAKKVLKILIEAINHIGRKVSRVSWISRVTELREYYSKYYYVDDNDGLRAWKVLKVIRDVLPKDSIVTTGVGKHQMWIMSFWEVLWPKTLITSGGMGTMGFGLPAAIGAKVARPDRAVINLDGDGSFLMTMNNLATAIDFNIPVITVVFDNRSLGLVRQVQELFFKGRVVGVDFGLSTDYVKLAEGFGAAGYDVKDYNDLRVAVKKALEDGIASVIRVPIDRDEYSLPQLPPGGSLKEVILCDPKKSC